MIDSLPVASISNISSTPVCGPTNVIFTISGTAGATVTYNINGVANATTVLTGGVSNITVTGAATTQTINLISVTDGHQIAQKNRLQLQQLMFIHSLHLL